MANDDDECDSSSLLTFASQSDVNSFLNKQAAKITGIHSNISDDDDDDENSIDDNLLRSFTRANNSNKKSSLSHSCFASISSEKQTLSDDLTELKWLNTFKFKQFQDKTSSNNNQISQLINELKYVNENDINTITSNVSIFLAFYSKHNDQTNAWSLTMKQLYEYIQKHYKHLTNKRGWKNLLKQTLITNPCFIKTKSDLSKTHSIWTIDTYYRPLLTKAYLTSLENKHVSSNEKQSESIVKNFAPKATVKTKALPRLYERLCEEKEENDDESDSSHIANSVAGRKRRRSGSTSTHRQPVKNNNDEKCLSSSSPWTLKFNKQSHTNSNMEKSKKRSDSTESIEYEPSTSQIDHDDNNHLSNNSIRKSPISTRGNKTEHVHRRKSSPPKKRLSLGLITHRPNTRINKKIIEQDLELLRQAQPLDLSLNPMK